MIEYQKNSIDKDLSDKWFHIIFRHASNVIFLIDDDGNYLVSNPAAQQTTGYTEEELKTKSIYDLTPFHNHDFVRSTWSKFIESEGCQQAEIEMLTKDSRIIVVDYRAVANVVPRVHLAIFHDVTRKRECEIQMKQYQSILATTLQKNAISEVISNIAHEVNQPLTAISSYADACLFQLSNLTEQSIAIVQDLLRRIVSQTQRAGQVTHRLKNYVHHSKPDYQRVNIKKMIDNVKYYLDNEINEHDVTLEVQADEELDYYFDRVGIEQVLHNLIKNAIEAMRHCPKPKIIIQVTLLEQQKLQIKIHDNGDGLTDSQIDSVFQPFYTTKSAGTGLGLSLCKSIIQSHEGTMSVSSAGKGKGTCFTIELPEKKPIEVPVKTD